MKRFIFKILILLFFLLLPLFIINELYVHTNYWKTENGINRFADVPYNIELGNLGSSHGTYNLKYDAVPQIRTWNFAMDSQPFFYDLAILKKYINHFKKGGVVLILISYFDITFRADYSAYRSRYYRLLPKKELDSWSLKEYICYCKFPILSGKKIIYKILYDIPKEGLPPPYEPGSFLTEELLNQYCIQRHMFWTNPKYEKGKEGFYENIKDVSAIIDFCLENELIPVLTTTPIIDVMNEIYGQNANFFPIFEQFKRVLTSKYPDLIYLDYSRDKNFSNNHKLFLNGDHLNEIGAQKFTRTVVEELQKRGLLK